MVTIYNIFKININSKFSNGVVYTRKGDTFKFYWYSSFKVLANTVCGYAKRCVKNNFRKDDGKNPNFTKHCESKAHATGKNSRLLAEQIFQILKLITYTYIYQYMSRDKNSLNVVRPCNVYQRTHYTHKWGKTITEVAQSILYVSDV